MIKLGITGNIGCGKSSIGNYLSELGFPVIDSDEIVHGLLASSNLYTQELIQVCFPFSITSEEPEKPFISRAKLGKILFADSKIKEQVEKILHPACAERTLQFFNKKQEEGRLLAANLIPLLVETKAFSRYDKTLLVYCEPSVQLERLIKRNPELSLGEIKKRVNSQLPQEGKKSQVDFVIDNSASIKETFRQLDEVLRELLKQ